MKVYCQGNVVTVDGLEEGVDASFFNIEGQLIGRSPSIQGTATLTIDDGKTGDVVVIVAGGDYLKAVLP